MKKQFIALLGLILALTMTITGCGEASNPAGTESGDQNATASGPANTGSTGTATEEGGLEAEASELIVRFGGGGEPFVMHLEDNSTAAAIAGYVGTSSWNLPIYSYDESDVMEYYDIPSRYDIPDNSQTVTHAQAGQVFYSDPNRIVLYYADAEINEEYTLIGTFDATEEFIDAVVNNPVLEGWGNQIVVISAGE